MTTYTKEQQAENRAKWVAALRSGEYEQTDGKLHKDGIGYCCLGVACDLAVKAGVIEAPGFDDEGLAWYGTPEHRDTDELPHSVRDWLGLRGEGGALGETIPYGDTDEGTSTVADTLIELNDDANYTFDQIADVIESGGVRLAE